MSKTAAWRLPVAKWIAWDSGSKSGAAPDLGFIEPLLRRRLSPLARAALHVANACCDGYQSVRFVYASRHGELGRTVELLRNLVHNEPLSPTTFSLSVLNSAAGVFAIARSDHAPATAIAAGRESFGFGLLEAYTRHRLDPATPVLYVYADAPAPDPIGSQPGDPGGILAVAMLIDSASSGGLAVGFTAGNGEADGRPQALSCVDALHGNPGRWSSGARTWHWEQQ